MRFFDQLPRPSFAVIYCNPILASMFVRQRFLLNKQLLRSTSSSTTVRAGKKMAADLPFTEVFFLDSFANRQWEDPQYSGTRISFDKTEFTRKIHEYHKNGAPLVDGYAPFCKHIFVPNFVGAKVGNLAITDANRAHLRTGYSKRRPEELAVLTRWFPLELVEPVPEAKMLDIILYSREQLLLEYDALPAADKQPLPDSPWGIISIKAQDEDHETPMQPITMMRNALGRDQGGSGVPLDRAKYEQSVAYWETHAPIIAVKDGQVPKGD